MGTNSEEAALPFQCSLPFTIDINTYESKFFPVREEFFGKKVHPRKSRKLFPSVKTVADHGKKTVQSPPRKLYYLTLWQGKRLVCLQKEYDSIFLLLISLTPTSSSIFLSSVRWLDTDLNTVSNYRQVISLFIGFRHA